jgi:trimeric autotransporter adhesin
MAIYAVNRAYLWNSDPWFIPARPPCAGVHPWLRKEETGIGDSQLRRIDLTCRLDFLQSRRAKTDLESGGGRPPAGFFACSRPCSSDNQLSGEKEKKENIMDPLIQFKTTVVSLVITAVLVCFGLLPKAQAVNPPPDGGYPGGNTAEGTAALRDLTTGEFNTAIGLFSLTLNTGGDFNTGVGASALRNNTTGNQNTAVGADALRSNITGFTNTANGYQALHGNQTGHANTGVGAAALSGNRTGNLSTAIGFGALALNNADGNTAVGSAALSVNTTGIGNTAVGTGALLGNKTHQGNTAVGTSALGINDADGNTAVGAEALTRNTTGIGNTAVGVRALKFSDSDPGVPNTGSGNTALGAEALLQQTGGLGGNTAVGARALQKNVRAPGNTAVGVGALQNLAGPNAEDSLNTAVGAGAMQNATQGNNNTAIGADKTLGKTTGDRNTAIGSAAGSNLTTGNDNIDIANGGVAGESGTIRIGSAAQTRTFIAGISGATASGGVAVFVNADGQLGTLTSSARFKDEITPMDKASNAILALKPVTFRYKKEIDPKSIPQFGLVAEEVEKVNADLVARDKEGKPYTVRYDQVNAMLLNEFLKEHCKVQEQGATIAQLKSTVGKQEASIAQQRKDFETAIAQQRQEIQILTAQLKEQASQIEKVNARLGPNTLQVAENN